MLPLYMLAKLAILRPVSCLVRRGLPLLNAFYCSSDTQQAEQAAVLFGKLLSEGDSIQSKEEVKQFLVEMEKASQFIDSVFIPPNVSSMAEMFVGNAVDSTIKLDASALMESFPNDGA